MGNSVSILIRISSIIASDILLKSTAFGKLLNPNLFPIKNWKTFLDYLISYKDVEYITLFLSKYKTIIAASFISYRLFILVLSSGSHFLC